MPRRREQPSGLRRRSRWLAGSLGLTLAAGAAGLALTAAGPAGAAVQPSYHAGRDQATFTVTGVEDSNCVVSTGGRAVFIKPGDRIDFDTAIASASLGGVNLLGGRPAGLNVTASVDGQPFDVDAGQRVRFSSLSKGTHTLRWTASSVSVRIPGSTGLLGQVIKAHRVKIPLQSGQLKSGAKLDWSGHAYVTTSAPKCRISLSTPRVHASAGPVHVSVPPVNVGDPTTPSKLPKVPKLGSSPSTATQGTGGTKSGSKRPTVDYTPSDDGSQAGKGAGNTDGTNGSVGTQSSGPVANEQTSGARPIKFASSATDSPSGQLPVLLAILAVLALAFVAGTYARLYLLGRKK